MSTLLKTRCLASAISLTLGVGGVRAATITVDSADDSPASTHCNLRDALRAIKDGSTSNAPTCSVAISADAFGANDTVTFAEGLAGSTITLTQGSLVLIGSPVAIQGSGQIIDAAGQGAVIETGTNLTFSFRHLSLTGGANMGNGGGGVTIESGSSAQFVDFTILGNTAKANGGGLYAGPAAAVTIVDSKISGNVADMGGGIFADSATVIMTNSVIADNEARYSGGGIYSALAPLSLSNATIEKNTAGYLSGGLVSFAGTVDISHSTISKNSGALAGGIFASGSSGAITSSTISGNTATCDYSCGGALDLRQSTFSISASTLSGNLATGHATNVSGGALLFESTATFLNSTLSGNIGVGDAQVSGAVWLYHFDSHGLTFVNSTISNNTAVAFYGKAAGGVMLGSLYPPAMTSESLSLVNTIVSSNLPNGSDLAWDPEFSKLSAAYSVLGSAQNVAELNDPGNHNIFTDSPGLGPLLDNGGPTKTRALLPASPALRASNRAALATFAGWILNYDQRGMGYPRDFSGSVDIGAYQDQGDRLFASGFESGP